MSRIGRKPIPIPKAVQVSVAEGVVQVKGPKGALSQRLPSAIAVQVEGDQINVTRGSDEPDVRALHGLVRALLANALSGVTSGF